MCKKVCNSSVLNLPLIHFWIPVMSVDFNFDLKKKNGSEDNPRIRIESGFTIDF